MAGRASAPSVATHFRDYVQCVVEKVNLGSRVVHTGLCIVMNVCLRGVRGLPMLGDRHRLGRFVEDRPPNL